MRITAEDVEESGTRSAAPTGRAQALKCSKPGAERLASIEHALCPEKARALCRDLERSRSLSTLVHPALAEEQPVEGHGLLGGEGDQEVGVRGRAVLVAIDVLLEDAEVSSKLTL